MTSILATLDTFTRQYVKTAMWSSTDDDGANLDDDYDVSDIAPDTLAQMVADCKDFQTSFGNYIIDNLGRAGHDFWLTRNGHGAGFWNGDWEQPMPTGDEDGPFPPHSIEAHSKTIGGYLTIMSKSYGSYNLYVGDDGLIYGQ